MLNERQRLDEQIKSIELQLSQLPNGNFFCSHTGKYTKWFQTDGKTQTYIPKKNRSLAEKLATKKYLSLLLKDLLNEKAAIELYLKHHNPEGSKAERLLSSIPEYQQLLSPFFTPISKELLDWMNSPYERNTKYPEKLIHKAHSGIYVRSKSEAIIDMFLHMNHIPFRYECALQLGPVITYPDFTIRHPQTGKIYYWEHFGLMDNPDYCKNTYSKLQLYSEHRIYPTIQLITTYETKENPLDAEIVEKTVEHYFLL